MIYKRHESSNKSPFWRKTSFYFCIDQNSYFLYNIPLLQVLEYRYWINKGKFTYIVRRQYVLYLQYVISLIHFYWFWCTVDTGLQQPVLSFIFFSVLFHTYRYQWCSGNIKLTFLTKNEVRVWDKPYHD